MFGDGRAGERSKEWMLGPPVWEMRAVVGSCRERQSRLRVVQFGTHGHLWNNKMADVSRRLKLRSGIKINILESFCLAQFSKYLLNDMQ